MSAPVRRKARRGPCVCCRTKVCHNCRDEWGDRFWFPFCFGGAVRGTGWCTCRPETERQRAARLRMMERESRLSFQRQQRAAHREADARPPMRLVPRLRVVGAVVPDTEAETTP